VDLFQARAALTEVGARAAAAEKSAAAAVVTVARQGQN